MIPLAEARSQVLDACPSLPARAVPLDDALGCVVKAAVVADEAVPGFDNSAMDGFAVRSADTAGASETHPVTLHVVATVAAGASSDITVGPGEAVRIMTGAPMPAGADAVVLVERSEPAGDDCVGLSLEVTPGTSVRWAGDDIRVGDEVLPAGTVVGPAHLGVLASLGRTEVHAVSRPTVGVLSTGDELVAPGLPLEHGQIRDSNRPMLVALVAGAGADAVDLGHVRDDADAVEHLLRSGVADCDLLVTSGGVSMGDFDVVKEVLGRVAAVRWMQIAIRPAKPFALGLLEGVPILGLPGNPVSSLVSFTLLARPAIRQRSGRVGADLDLPHVTAVADAAFERRPDGKTHFVRVRTTFDGTQFHVGPVAAQGSHQLAATAAADGLVTVPDGDGVEAGDDVEVLLLDAAATLTRGW